jgi:hypothetical protein
MFFRRLTHLFVIVLALCGGPVQTVTGSCHSADHGLFSSPAAATSVSGDIDQPDEAMDAQVAPLSQTNHLEAEVEEESDQDEQQMGRRRPALHDHPRDSASRFDRPAPAVALLAALRSRTRGS